MKQNKHKVLVTGGLGYIGSAVSSALSRNDIAHISVDKRKDGAEGHVALDLLSGPATAALLEDEKPTVIIHTATHSAIAYRESFFESFKEDFSALYVLLDSLKRMPKTRLIYFSSNYVYSGMEKDSVVTETDRILPTHNFGVGKYFFEEYIIRNHPESVVFRLSSVFGSGTMLHPNALFNMAEEAKKTGEIAVWGAGARMMQYIYLPDVIRFALSAFSVRPGVYNLGGDEYISVADTARAIADLFNAKTVFLKEKTEGETLPRMDTSKLRNELKSEQYTPFKDALAAYLSVYDKK